MHEEGDTVNPPSAKAVALGLKAGEWRMCCPNCDFKLDDHEAAKPICPDCRARLHVAAERID